MPLFREIIGIPPSSASTSDSVLVIIDAQNEYASGQLKVRDVEKSRAAIASLLEKYRATAKATGKPNVVHVVHETPAGAPVFTQGTSLAEEFEELKPVGGEKVVVKNFPNSFAKTDLHEYLQGIGAKKVVLVGYMAHVCVSTTARAAGEFPYDVVIPQDAVGDRDIPGHDGHEVVKVVLAELADAFATVVSSKDIN